MFIRLSCDSCDSELKIPMMVGGMYPNVESFCKKCGSGVLLVKEIQLKPSKATNNNTVKKINSSVDRIPSALQDTIDHSPVIDHSPGGRQILTSFHNRISTVVVLIQLMDEIADNDRVISVSELLERFNSTSNQIRRHLKNVEGKLGVKRGEKLSDGYPEDNDENQGPMRIAHRNIIGTDGQHILFKRGLIQQLGLVEAISGKEFRLTEKANPFIDIPCLKSELLLLDEPELIATNPKLPKYFKEDTSIAILNALFDAMPDEKDWAMHILETIEMASMFHEDGWDSNQYAREEASNCANGLCHPRWSTHDGKTLFEKYQDRAKRQRKRSPDDHAADRLEKFINGSLGGLLSRMKELGLIIPVRLGNTKNFRTTKFGEIVRYRFKSKELVE